MTNYPAANRTAQWFQDDYPGTLMPRIEKAVWHSTETTGWPAYGGGKSAPTYTVRWNSAARRWDWRAHFPDERSARALQNDAGGQETNRLNLVQVEIVGTCDPAAHRRWAGTEHVYTPELSAVQIDGLADFCRYMKRQWGVPYTCPRFVAYPGSYGERAPQRLHGTAWRTFKGHCGHQHVDENDHGDPGLMPMARILARAAELDEEENMPSAEEIAAAVWNHDGVAHADPGNPVVQAKTALAWVLRGVDKLNAEQPVMGYVDAIYNEPDDKMSLTQAAQHAAAQAFAARAAAAQAGERLAALEAKFDALIEKLDAPAGP